MEKSKEKKIPNRVKKVVIVCLGIIATVAVVISGVIFFNAQKIGEETSLFMADRLATAVGSVEGVVEAMAQTNEAFEEGKAEGLSARDTTVRVIQNVLSDGEQILEVYSAGIGLKNVHKVSDTYTALYIIKATAIFSIDMAKADVSSEDKKIIVTLPPIKCNLNIDNGETEKLAEQSREIFDGSTSDGYEAYINSIKNIDSETEKVLEENPHLKNSAENAAKKAVERLVKSVCGNEYSYEIKCNGITAEEKE